MKNMNGVNNMIGQKVIIRANEAGVFFGTIEEKNGSEVILTNCRRLWEWSGASSVSQLANSGTSKPKECLFTEAVNSICILGVIEIIPCTITAIKSIEEVAIWKI